MTATVTDRYQEFLTAKRPAVVDRGQPITAALVVLDPTSCPTCGGPLDQEQVEEDALFRHGGHGATRRSIRLHCRCGWSLLTEQSEVRPPR